MTFQTVNNKQATGALDADINASATSLSVGAGEGANFPDGPSVLLVDEELVWYTTKSTDTFSGLIRGYGDTTAASHTAGADVAAMVAAEWFNDMVTSITAAPTIPVDPVVGQGIVYDAGALDVVDNTDFVVSADYTFSTFVPANAIDGDPATYYQDDGNNGAFYVDLGEAKDVARIRLQMESIAGNFGGAAFRTVRISYSDTGTSGPWISEGTFIVGDTHEIDDTPGFAIELPAVSSHRYWRIDQANAWWKLYTLEFLESLGDQWLPRQFPINVADHDDVTNTPPTEGQALVYRTSSEEETALADYDRLFLSDIYSGQSPSVILDGNGATTLQTGGNAQKDIIFDFGPNNAKTVVKMILETDSTLATWTLAGSNDLSSWTDLQSGIVNTAVDTEETFDIGTTGSYRYYRMRSASGGWTVLRTMVPVVALGQWVPGAVAVEGTVVSGDTEGDLLQWTGDYFELYDEKADVSITFDVPDHVGTVANLIDRSEATEYRGQWGHGGGWMYFDFGQVVTLDRISFVNGGYSTATVTDIEYSSDGVSYTSDSSGLTASGSNGETVNVDLAASRTARYFRIYVDGGGQYVPAWMELYFYVSDIRWVPTTPAALFESMGIFTGTGSPESAVTADVGALYLRTDGGASTTLYVKESGTGNTGWVAK